MNRRNIFVAGFLALATLWTCLDAGAAEVRAWLDRNAMQMGETVTLNVEVSGDNGAAKPDFSALGGDFELLGTQSSTSMSIINGQTTSKLLWAIGLEPKRAGNLTIPPLSVAGSQTQALSLAVAAAVADANGKPGADIYIEASADPRAPYVQQQVRFTVKLYFALNLTDGSLDDPRAEGVVVRKLGQDANYSAEVGGRRYRVLERHYALLPENSGSLTLPPISLRGHAMDPGDINGFFNRGRSISAHSEAVTLDVRPRPAASGSDAWLPARAVTLSAEGIDAATPARVGEPLTLTLHLKAQGLGFEQLPELKLPKIEGADVYPDKASTQNRDDGEWLYGDRERKFAIVPNRPGPLTLPVISVAWWDTAHDRAEVAELPAQTLNVQPGAALPAKADSIAATNPVRPSINQVAAATSTSGLPGEQDKATQLWRRVALSALALWIVTAVIGIAWLVSRRRRASVPAPEAAPIDPTVRASRAAFQAACTSQDWSAAARALLSWARTVNAQTRNLGELSLSLSDQAQVAAIGELEQACYGTGATPGLATRLRAAFAKDLSIDANRATRSAASALPALYPFRV
jgi:hypothetical protein